MNDTREKKATGAWAHLISEVLSFIPKDLREFIGFMAGMYILISLPMLILGGVKLVQKNIDKPESSNTQCWQIQKVDNRLFKLNSCTGETIEITQPETNTRLDKLTDGARSNTAVERDAQKAARPSP